MKKPFSITKNSGETFTLFPPPHIIKLEISIREVKNYDRSNQKRMQQLVVDIPSDFHNHSASLLLLQYILYVLNFRNRKYKKDPGRINQGLILIYEFHFSSSFLISSGIGISG